MIMKTTVSLLIVLLAAALVWTPTHALLSPAARPWTPTLRSSSSSTTALTTTTTAMQISPGGGGGGLEQGGGTATIPNEVFNLVKSIVGAGVLSLPYGVAVFGNAPSAIIPAIALIAAMGTLSAYTFGIIGRLCQATSTDSYAGAWDASVGKKWSPLVAFSCFVDCLAGNLSYSMILADTIQNLAAAAGYATLSRTQALLGVTSVVLLPLCLLKNLSSLAPFSLVGIVGMLYTTAAMGLRYFQGAYSSSSGGGAFFATQLTPPVFGTAGAAAAVTNPATLILACMLSNAYIAHFNAPKFLSELKNNTMARFHQVIAWSFGTSIALYALITAFGFLTFGGASNGLILNNYSNKDVIASLSRIAVAVSITCSYPLIFVGCRDGLLDLFSVQSKDRSSAVLNRVTLVLLGLVTLLASRLTDLGLVASIGGATFGTALVFVYPAIMFLKARNVPKKSWENAAAVAIGVLGVVMGGIGTVLSFRGQGH